MQGAGTKRESRDDGEGTAAHVLKAAPKNEQRAPKGAGEETTSPAASRAGTKKDRQGGEGKRRDLVRVRGSADVHSPIR